MAPMEKITFQPLINHLSEQSDFYNQMYRENDMNYGAINHSLLASWIASVVEPIVKDVFISHPDHLPQIFKAFYIELLQILSNKSGIIYENEYKAAWKLCHKNPTLTATYPLRLLKAINSALESIRTYQPEKVLQWISLMDNTLINCKTIEEFLACGRIYAWMSGMAHLRTKAETEFFILRDELKHAILNNNPEANVLERAFRNEWPKLKKPQFMGEAGGFVGFGGPFTTPPIVALLENELFATDKQNSCAFFADCFGKTLITEIPVSPKKIIEKSSVRDLNLYKSSFGSYINTFNDITSYAIKNCTLVLTRASSHYLFVYGRPYE
jgi:hypothetical protein